MAIDRIYDIETYPNIALFGFKCTETKQRWRFEISTRRDDRQAFFHFMSTKGWRAVGYNNIGFDYIVMHWFVMNPHATVQDIYNYAMSVITSDWDDKFAFMVWESDWIVGQVDLYKIHHFDNRNKATSLKMLEFNMRRRNVCDLPFPVGTWLTDHQMDELGTYNDEDLDATEEFYYHTLSAIRFRENFSSIYGRNFVNHNNGKIGRDIIVEKLGQDLCYTRVNGKKEPRQTIRQSIKLSDVIFPYIKFEHPHFKIIHQWLLNRTIYATKGSLSEITVDYATASVMDPKEVKVYGMSEADYFAVFNKKAPITILDGRHGVKFEPILKSGIQLDWSKLRIQAEHLNTMINGFTFVFGTGGIHGSVESQILRSDDDYVITDFDVASYYPNLAIKNKLYPEHLGVGFCNTLLEIFEERVRHPKDKYPEINQALKDALNVPYGDSNNEHSPFRDSQYTMKITINGQLLLYMLAEQMIKVPGLTLVQVNTDGVTVRYPRINRHMVDQIADWWQRNTLLTLEAVDYKLMAIKNVSAYIAVNYKNKIKRKKDYCYVGAHTGRTDEMDWNQPHSALIVAMAAEAAILLGADIRDYITAHGDWFDFMLVAKVGKKEQLTIGGQRVQSISRYYLSHSGGEMRIVRPPKDDIKYVWTLRNPTTGKVKEFKTETTVKSAGTKGFTEILSKIQVESQPTSEAVCSGWRVKECNDMSTFTPADLNYEWYIAEAEKLVKPLISG